MMVRRYSLILESPSENWPRIVVLYDGNRLMTLDRESAELLVSQLGALIDAIKALEAIDDSDANGESAS